MRHYLALTAMLCANAIGAEMSLIVGKSCEKLEGKWQGTMQSRFESTPQPLQIIFSKDCNYEWSGAVSTPGVLTIKTDALRYSNKLGSRGIVTMKGDVLEWRNAYTGNNYVVNVKRSND